MNRTIAALIIGIIIGALGALTIRPALADQPSDVHRIAVAVEQIARHLERCK